MLWLILSLITAAIYSFTAFLDNYVADVVFKNKKPQSIKVFNGATYLVFALILAIIFGVSEAPIENILLVMLSGVIASISSIPYYIALKEEEATGAAIYYQLQPIFYLLASVLFFGETISGKQIIALIMIMAAPVIIVLSRKRKKSRERQVKNAGLFVFYIFLLAVSGIISTHGGGDMEYNTLFIYFLFGRGLSDVVLSIACPSWRKRFTQIFKENPIRLIGAVGLNQLLCIIAEFTSRLALIIGTSAIVSALVNSSELILTFILGIFLTLKWPKFGREHLHRHIIIAHLIGIILCVAGVLILELA